MNSSHYQVGYGFALGGMGALAITGVMLLLNGEVALGAIVLFFAMCAMLGYYMVLGLWRKKTEYYGFVVRESPLGGATEKRSNVHK